MLCLSVVFCSSSSPSPASSQPEKRKGSNDSMARRSTIARWLLNEPHKKRTVEEHRRGNTPCFSGRGPVQRRRNTGPPASHPQTQQPSSCIAPHTPTTNLVEASRSCHLHRRHQEPEKIPPQRDIQLSLTPPSQIPHRRRGERGETRPGPEGLISWQRCRRRLASAAWTPQPRYTRT